MSMFKYVPESCIKRRRHGKSDTVVPPPSPPPSMPKSGGGGSGTSREQTVEEDVVTILNAVIKFRANNNGDTPTRSTITPIFFDAINNSLNQKLTIDQLCRKFRTLKDRYHVKSRMDPTTAFDHQFLNLSRRAWGEKEKEKKNTSEEEEENDESEASKENEEDHSFKLLTEEVKKHWKATGMDISLSLLELGLKFIDKEKAATLEKKWEKHIEAGWMNIEVKTCDVKKEYLDALCGAVEKAEK